MGPVGHTAISTVIGATVWGTTGSPLAGGIAVGVGVLIDVDHLIDYYRWWVSGRPNKFFVVFHGWEYSFIGILMLALGYYDPILLAVTLAHLGHIMTDHLYNRMTPLGYFILYRAWVRFDAGKLAPGIDLADSYQSLPEMFPLRPLWEPWYRRRVEPWIARRVARSRDGTKTQD